eukprot:GDKI01024772.1.p1 GENE.GDKI01024772.1~~GDKI01024772.1.p1  ORF type:complete len:466 (+),score=131.65 GDKI01024772.1:152-1549(+)
MTDFVSISYRPVHRLPDYQMEPHTNTKKPVSFGALSCGCVCFLWAFVVLYFGEQKWLKNLEPMRVGMREAIHVHDCVAHPENAGKLVYMHCQIEPSNMQPMGNYAFKRELGQIIREHSPVLEEIVEMFQYREYMGEERSGNFVIKKIKHDRIWSNTPLYCPRGGDLYKNPPMYTRGGVYTNQVRLGSGINAFVLDAPILKEFWYRSETASKISVSLSSLSPVSPIDNSKYEFSIAREKNILGGDGDEWVFALSGKRKYTKEDDLYVGDYRVRWVTSAVQSFTVVGKQEGNRIVPWELPDTDDKKQGKEASIFWIQQGDMTLQQIASIYVHGRVWEKLMDRAPKTFICWFGVMCFLAVFLDTHTHIPKFIPMVGGKFGDDARVPAFVFTFFLAPAVACVMLACVWMDVSFVFWSGVCVVAPVAVCFVLSVVGKKKAKVGEGEDVYVRVDEHTHTNDGGDKSAVEKF